MRIEIAAVKVSGVRAHFSSRSTIAIRWADVQLDEAQFDAPALVVGASAEFRHGKTMELAEGDVEAAVRSQTR